MSDFGLNIRQALIGLITFGLAEGKVRAYLPEEMQARLKRLFEEDPTAKPTAEDEQWYDNEWKPFLEIALGKKARLEATQRELAKRAARQNADAIEAEQSGKDKFDILTIPQLFAREPTDYIIDQWVPENALVEVVGPRASMKSFLMCDAGLSVASGQKSFHGYPIVLHGPVVYIAAEGAGLFQYRVRAWCRARGIDPSTVPFHVIPMPVNLRSPAAQKRLREIIRKLKPVMVIVDTLSRCTPGADQSSGKDMGEVVLLGNDLQQDCPGLTLALIHHPTKADEKGPGKGSGDVVNAADTEFRTSVVDEDREAGSVTIKVLCTKQKDDLKPEPLFLVAMPVPVLDESGNPMFHKSGRKLTTLLLERAQPGDAAALPPKAKDKKKEADDAIDAEIMKFLWAHPGSNQSTVVKHVTGTDKKVRGRLGALSSGPKASLRMKEVKEGKATLFCYWPL